MWEQMLKDMMLSFFKKYPDIYKYIENSSIVFREKNRFIEGGDFSLTVDDIKNTLNKLNRVYISKRYFNWFTLYCLL